MMLTLGSLCRASVVTLLSQIFTAVFEDLEDDVFLPNRVAFAPRPKCSFCSGEIRSFPETEKISAFHKDVFDIGTISRLESSQDAVEKHRCIIQAVQKSTACRDYFLKGRFITSANNPSCNMHIFCILVRASGGNRYDSDRFISLSPLMLRVMATLYVSKLMKDEKLSKSETPEFIFDFVEDSDLFSILFYIAMYNGSGHIDSILPIIKEKIRQERLYSLLSMVESVKYFYDWMDANYFMGETESEGENLLYGGFEGFMGEFKKLKTLDAITLVSYIADPTTMRSQKMKRRLLLYIIDNCSVDQYENVFKNVKLDIIKGCWNGKYDGEIEVLKRFIGMFMAREGRVCPEIVLQTFNCLLKSPDDQTVASLIEALKGKNQAIGIECLKSILSTLKSYTVGTKLNMSHLKPMCLFFDALKPVNITTNNAFDFLLELSKLGVLYGITRTQFYLDCVEVIETETLKSICDLAHGPFFIQTLRHGHFHGGDNHPSRLGIVRHILGPVPKDRNHGWDVVVTVILSKKAVDTSNILNLINICEKHGLLNLLFEIMKYFESGLDFNERQLSELKFLYVELLNRKLPYSVLMLPYIQDNRHAFILTTPRISATIEAIEWCLENRVSKNFISSKKYVWQPFILNNLSDVVLMLSSLYTRSSDNELRNDILSFVVKASINPELKDKPCIVAASKIASGALSKGVHKDILRALLSSINLSFREALIIEMLRMKFKTANSHRVGAQVPEDHLGSPNDIRDVLSRLLQKSTLTVDEVFAIFTPKLFENTIKSHTNLVKLVVEKLNIDHLASTFTPDPPMQNIRS